MRQYNIVGRLTPNAKNPNPNLYKMTIFAGNHVVAKSRFWYFTSMLRKIKKTHGEIVSCEEVSTPSTESNYYHADGGRFRCSRRSSAR